MYSGIFTHKAEILEYRNNLEKMNIWEKDGYVFIKVSKNFTYDFNISKINRLGDENDAPGLYSMWGWINHLREKNWWNDRYERSFKEICEKIIK